jgi:hypothetical protein
MAAACNAILSPGGRRPCRPHNRRRRRPAGAPFAASPVREPGNVTFMHSILCACCCRRARAFVLLAQVALWQCPAARCGWRQTSACRRSRRRVRVTRASLYAVQCMSSPHDTRCGPRALESCGIDSIPESPCSLPTVATAAAASACAHRSSFCVMLTSWAVRESS